MFDPRCEQLAIHKFRAAHKTSSSIISLLHLVSIYGTHPELRPYLRARLFVSLTGVLGGSTTVDKSLENQNEGDKERNVGQSLLTSMRFARLQQPMMHVHRTWKLATGARTPGNEGVRVSMANEIEALVCMFEAKLGRDLTKPTRDNPFWHTGTPTRLYGQSNVKRARPWEFIWRVAAATSSGHRTTTVEAWRVWATRMLQHHMFSM
jgi:hypothetical protein